MSGECRCDRVQRTESPHGRNHAVQQLRRCFRVSDQFLEAIAHGLRRDTGFRLVVRSKNYDLAETLANKAMATLTIPGELALNNILVKICRTVIEPKPYSRWAGA